MSEYNLPFVPIGKTLLIKLDEIKDKERASGIIIRVERDFSLQDTGVIVAIGELAYRDAYKEPPVKVGDRVMFNNYDCPYIDARDKDECCYRVVLDGKVYGKLTTEGVEIGE